MQRALLKILFIAIFLLPTLELSSLFAQNAGNIDSLEQELEKSLVQGESDSVINALLFVIFNHYENNEWGKSVKTAKQGISLFKTTNLEYCQLWYENLGFLYLKHDIYQLALNTYYEGFSVGKNSGKPIGVCYNNIARVYLSQNLNLNKAEKLLLKAIEEHKKLPEKREQLSQLAYSYNQLGIVYERQKKYESALDFYKKALDIRKEINDVSGLVNSFYTIAYYYNTINEYDSAIVYFNKGLKINKNQSYQISLLINRAIAFAYNNNFHLAHDDIDLALKIANQKSSFDQCRIYKYQSQIFQIEGNVALAIISATKGLDIADTYNHSLIKLEILSLLVGYFEKTDNYKKALFYQNQYIELKKLKNREKNKIVQNSYAIQENDLVNSLQSDNVELEKHNEQLVFIILFSALGFLLLIMLLIILYRNKRRLNKIYKETRVHAVIAKVLGNITGKQRSLEVFLQDSLEEILKIPWLKFETKGSIFLTNKDGNLKMVAHKNLGEPLLKMCDIVKPGECLCGKTLEQKSMVYCDHISEKHDFHPEGMTPHGHYNIPIMFHGEILGVLNLYLAEGHEKQDYEIEFLESICKTLASVINRKTIQLELSEQAKEQEKINQKLSEQSLEVEHRNIEIQQYTEEQEKLNQKLFAQKLEVEQRNNEVERISKEQEETNQKLFAQKMEVEQRNIEIQQHTEEQEKLNQKLFAQKLEVEQRNSEVERISKEQEETNQKIFAQKMEVEQRNIEIQQYTEEQEKLNQKLFAQKLEVEQRNSEVERISKEQEMMNQKLFAQKMEVEQRNIEIEKYAEEQDKLNQKFFAQTLELDQRNIEINRYADELGKQKDEIESAHKSITDSINYAQTIQKALLPTGEMIKSILKEHLIVYKPRNVVSGDFYYVAERSNHIVFAVADCTGHGVPGGFLTMLGVSYMNDIIKRKEIQSSAEALEQLRDNIKGVFDIAGSRNQNGLDIALCSINKKTKVLNYSGANSPLYIFRDGELLEFKATKNPIGWHPREIPFKNESIKLQDNDLIYLFSDGYHDQFGVKNKKFMKKRFKSLLLEIKDLPMEEQKEVLEGVFEKWKTNTEQTDDVTIMAVRWHQ